MDGIHTTKRVGGVLLALAGIGFFLSGALHPQPAAGTTQFHDAMTSMLSHPMWLTAHWISLVTGLLLVWALWLLADAGWADGSAAARAGVRLALLAALFMCVQWAVEIAAHGARDAYAANQAAPIVDLIDAMQAVGWPALGLGFALLAYGARDAAPRWLGLLALLGAVAVGLAGLLAQGLHILSAGVLFAGGNLLSLWLLWAGVRAARTRSADRVDAKKWATAGG